MLSNHTTTGTYSLEHMELYNIVIGEEWYIFVLQQVHKDFLLCHLFGACLYFTLRVTFVTAGRVRYRIASGSGKYIGFGLNGTERTTIVDIFNIIHTVCMYVCMYVCIFIKLHITAQSGLVILVILCHSR